MSESLGDAGTDGVSFGEERDFLRCPQCGRGYEVGVDRCSVDRKPLRPTRGRTLLGRVLAKRYRIQEVLGAGSMGEVYKAAHLLLDRPLALKVVLPSLAARPTAVALLRREASNASRVAHPNVVRVYDLEFDEGLIFLTMDYVAGPSLVDVVRALGPLAPRLVAEIIEQVARGLEAIHGLGIVHRDLKPSNVVLSRAADGVPLARLLDFGISRAFDDPEQSMTLTGMVVGTPVFMSPEQRSGTALDRRADVFALGVLTIYLLGGSLPRASSGTCIRLLDIPQATEWSDPIRRAIHHALMWKRSQRTDRASRFARELLEATATETPSWGQPTTIEEALASPRWRDTRDAPRVVPARSRELSVDGTTSEPDADSADSPADMAARAGARSLGASPSGPRVRVLSGPLEGREYRVGAEPVYIGRDATMCQIRFPESASFVSRVHASLVWNAASGRLVIVDEGSKNPTVVRAGERVEAGESVELHAGDTFSVGHPDFRFSVLSD